MTPEAEPAPFMDEMFEAFFYDQLTELIPFDAVSALALKIETLAFNAGYDTRDAHAFANGIMGRALQDLADDPRCRPPDDHAERIAAER